MWGGAEGSVAPRGDGPAAARVSELLQALPLHLAGAMPPTAEAGEAALAAAEAAEASAVSSYVQHALSMLQGSAAAPPPAPSASASDAAQSAEERLKTAYEQMERAYAAKLGALMLPGRSAPPGDEAEGE